MKERLLREAHLPPKKAYYPVAVAPMPPPQQLQLQLQQSPPVERDPVAESDRMWVELRALEQRQEAAEAARHRALKSAYAAKLASQSLGEHVEPRAKQLVTGTSTSAVGGYLSVSVALHPTRLPTLQNRSTALIASLDMQSLSDVRNHQCRHTSRESQTRRCEERCCRLSRPARPRPLHRQSRHLQRLAAPTRPVCQQSQSRNHPRLHLQPHAFPRSLTSPLHLYP